MLGNDLPIGPGTPAAAIIGAPALTASVEGASQQVVDAAQHPTKRQNTVDIRSLTIQPLLRHYQQQQTVFQQQNDLLQQQQRVIEQQQRQLQELRGFSNDPPTNQILRVDTNLDPPEQYNNIDGAARVDHPYYYYPYKYNYDFPAGFAYNGGVVQVVEQPRPDVIGVRGTETEVSIHLLMFTFVRLV